MVDVDEIDGPTKLERWIRTSPGDDELRRVLAVTLASRAALRVLPIVATGAPDSTSWQVMRASLIAFVSVDFPTPAIQKSTAAASAAASDAADVVLSASAPAADAAYAAAHAAASASAVEYAGAAHAAGRAAQSSAFATRVVAAKSWEHVRNDCSWLADGFVWMPLFGEHSIDAHSWEQVRRRWQGKGWDFWIRWYEGHLCGQPLPVALLEQVALIAPDDWDKGPEQVNPLIAEIERNFRSAVDTEAVLRGAIFDFSFDQIEGVMRAVQPIEDWRHLDDPDELTAFLRDAEALRRGLATLARALATTGGYGNVGFIRTYLDEVCNLMADAEDYPHLNIGQLIEIGRILDEEATSEDIRDHLGPGPLRALTTNIEELKRLISAHFAHALARSLVLRDLPLGEGEEPWAIIVGLREQVDRTRAGKSGALPPLRDADRAVLQEVLDGLDRLMRRADGASSEAAKESYARERNFQMAKIGATVAVYQQRGARVVKGVDDAIKWNKRITTIGQLLGWLKDFWL
ncbi:hypothetical protein [Pseudoroseicyclus sp. CXY001]|uniref:hypothetical protein n=1 Tax=Pseudoroseicyclus sp. CXY001 TaxID=3242492 RepID=UPI003570DDEA